MKNDFIHTLKSSVFPKTLISSIMLSVFVAPSILLADSCPPGTLCNPLKTDSFEALIGAILDVIIKLGIPIIVLFLVYTGFTFVTSQGDTKKLDTAKSMFWGTIAGTALIVGAKVILLILQNTITGITK